MVIAGMRRHVIKLLRYMAKLCGRSVEGPLESHPFNKPRAVRQGQIIMALPENMWVLEIGGRVDLPHEPLGLKHGGEFGP